VKIAQYNDMMAHLTRRQKFSNGGDAILPQPNPLSPQERNQKVFNDYVGRMKKYLADGVNMPEWFVKDLVTKKAEELGVELKADGGRIGFAGGLSPRDQLFIDSLGRFNTKEKVSMDHIGKIFKDKDWTKLKTATRPYRIEKGLADTGGALNTYQMKQIREAMEGSVKDQNLFAKKLGITPKQFLDGVKKSKAKWAIEKSEKMSKQMLKKVEFQEKLYKEISDNPGTIKQMAKNLDVSEKYLVEQSSKLLKNVYTQNVAIHKTPKFDIDTRGNKTLKSWLPDDFKSTDNFLENFANIKGLKKVQTDNMGILIKNAYGYGKNPKKYTEAMRVLGEYNKFVDTLPKEMKIDLDHPLSKGFLRGSGVSPDKLLHITPVDRKFNRGFKMQLGKKYNAALNLTDPNLKREAIKKIRLLANKTGVNIGEVIGKKMDFGATHLLDNKNWAKELTSNIEEQNLVSKNIEELKKTKEGSQIIKDVFTRGKVEVAAMKTPLWNKFLKSLPVQVAKGLLKTGARTVGAALPVVGPGMVVWGLSDVNKAQAAGLTSADELAVAYNVGPEVAQMWHDFKPKMKQNIEDMTVKGNIYEGDKRGYPAMDIEEQEEVVTENKPTYGPYADQIKKLKIS